VRGSLSAHCGTLQSGIVFGKVTFMTADTFREILHHRPFEPFRVVMSSGESYNVMHPEMALVSARSLILALPDPTQPEGERLAFCSYLHLAHVERLRPAEVAAGRAG
jgi:hypothetical protein